MVVTARKRSLQRLCFYRCLSFILFTGGACVVLFRGRAWFYLGGACVVYFGGACMVLFGGVRGFIWGGAWFYSGGAWFYLGGCMVLFRGACMVLCGGHAWFYFGGHAWFFQFFGYNEIRSMSGRHASYWNAFLLTIIFCFSLKISAFKRLDMPLS